MLYGKISHTKSMGIAYLGNAVKQVSPGLQAEREGVCIGWRIIEVSFMPAACVLYACCTPAA